jgi:hypothetical protein
VDVQSWPLRLWERQRGTPFDAMTDLQGLLPVARRMNLVFWIPLVVLGYRLGRRFGGPVAGVVAAGLLGFDPNLQAHARLATTDIAITAAVLLATEVFLATRPFRWGLRIGLPGGAYAIALLCKASAMMFVPIVLAVLGAGLCWNEPDRLRQLRRLFLDLLGIGCVGFAGMMLYVGSDWKPEPSFIKWTRQLPDSTPGVAELRTLAQELRIFPNGLEGIVQQIKHNFRGHGTSVFGEWHQRAVWYYFPVILSAKLTDVVLVLGLFGLLRGEPRSLRVLLLVLLFFTFTCRVQLGIRLMFPMVALLIVLGSTLLQDRPGPGMVVVFLQLLITVQAGPDRLVYQNALWSSQVQARHHLTDSNYDWGQGLPQLREWWQHHDQPDLYVWYYGGDTAALQPPFRFLALQHEKEPNALTLVARTRTGVLAVSESFFTACPDRRPETLAVLDWLQQQQPIATTSTFRIYQFR